jgi:hypothetical protein
MSHQNTPVFIICRDRVTCLRQLVAWLERAGQDRIYLVDNHSSYPPLLEHLDACPHTVLRLGENLGPLGVWRADLLNTLGIAGPYVVTDPDILPDSACPPDAIGFFQSVLDRFPAFDKVGFGLHVDDLPDTHKFRDEIICWERPFWEKEIASGLYAAHIDTTFALYRPGVPFKKTECIRTGAPYLARHTPWYMDVDHPSEEDAFYRAHLHAPDSYWSGRELHPRVASRATLS